MPSRRPPCFAGGRVDSRLDRTGGWGNLCHAYGTADDVAAQLAAITVGDHVTRKTAWWNLWGNIHHQGTIYAATAPAVPVLVRLADWISYPDRAEAIFFLCEVAEAEGVVVWSYDSDGELVHDEDLEAELSPADVSVCRDS